MRSVVPTWQVRGTGEPSDATVSTVDRTVASKQEWMVGGPPRSPTERLAKHWPPAPLKRAGAKRPIPPRGATV
jgi:hypothetical protein